MNVSLNAVNALPPPLAPPSSSPLHLSPWITGMAPEPCAAPSTVPGAGAARGASGVGALGCVALAVPAALPAALASAVLAVVAAVALEIDSAGLDEFLQPANTARLATRRRHVISRQYVTVRARANGPTAPWPWGAGSPAPFRRSSIAPTCEPAQSLLADVACFET